ncbi:MAG TPA: sugar transferase, partial [Gemmatimonadales bacterium]|nr:sugar transferase [Gemmatimonadales bacterium]
MSGVRSSHPSLPAIQLDPALTRQHYRDWSRAETWNGSETSSEWVRRGVNIILALIALVVTMPIMILVAVLVRLTSRGPVLYTQVRVGLDRRIQASGPQNHRRQHDLG